MSQQCHSISFPSIHAIRKTHDTYENPTTTGIVEMTRLWHNIMIFLKGLHYSSILRDLAEASDEKAATDSPDSPVIHL